jgi:hypothetical protein
MKVRDTLERLFWTIVAAFVGNLLAGAVFDVDVVMAAGMAAFTAGANFVLLVARARLAVLPDPGAGLPGLTVKRGKP